MQYFRQCVQHPPPPSFLSQSLQCRPSHSAGSQAALRHSTPPSSIQNTNQGRCYASRCTGNIAKLNVQTSDESSSSSPKACRLPSFVPVESRQTGTGSLLTRSFSDPLGKGKHQSDLAVQHAVDGDPENGRVDIASSDLMRSQVLDSAEELSSLGDRKDNSPEPMNHHASVVYRCAWTASRNSCRDSGCMSDLSSGGGDSPAATVSPHQSLMNDCPTNDQVSDDECVLTKHLSELELDRNVDGMQQKTAGDSLRSGMSVPVAVSAQTGVGAPAMRRYVRPMREIPPRFRRLLAAEAERVVRLCQRLNGSPLYSAATPSDGARQPNNDSGAMSSDASRDNQGADVDKALAGQTPYSAPSSLMYVTAQSSGLPVYPPASAPLTGYSNVNGVEPPSYVISLGVPDASLQGCGNGLPTAPDALPASVPMLLTNPVLYYPGATLPPPDVGSAFSYVVQTPAVSGCPPPGTAETGSQSAPGYVRNVASDHITVAADASSVGVFQSATNDVCSSYFYNSPGPELLPCCSLQMMQA